MCQAKTAVASQSSGSRGRPESPGPAGRAPSGEKTTSCPCHSPTKPPRWKANIKARLASSGMGIRSIRKSTTVSPAGSSSRCGISSTNLTYSRSN